MIFNGGWCPHFSFIGGCLPTFLYFGGCLPPSPQEYFRNIESGLAQAEPLSQAKAKEEQADDACDGFKSAKHFSDRP